MADITDLAQKLAFYQNGGRDPGTSGLDKFNSGLGAADSTIKDILAIKKAKLENEKLAADKTPVGNYFGVPSQKDETAQATTATTANNNYMQARAPLQTLPMDEQANLTPDELAAKGYPTTSPTPFVSKRSQFEQTYHFSPDTPMEKIPEVIKVAAMSGQIPMFINDSTQQISFDPSSILKGYRPFTQLKPGNASTIAGTQAAATAPMPTITDTQAITDTAAGKPPTKNYKIVPGITATQDSRAENLANAIISGGIPPDVTKLAGGRGGLGSMVLEKLAAKGYDYKGQNLQWQQSLAGTVGLAKSLNSTQMVQLQTSFNTVQQDIQPMRDISAELDRVGFTPANKLIVQARLNGVQLDPSAVNSMNENQVQVATKYITQINLMRDNMAVAFMRGGVPTDQAFKLTEQILNPVYSDPQTNAALDQVEKNLQFREHALNDVAVRMPGQPSAHAAPAAAGQSIEEKRALLRKKLIGGGQ